MSKKPKLALLLSLLFLGQFLFFSPHGEFALNDDWVHTEIIKHWVDSGELRMIPYAGPTFYVPILYGAGLTKLFGFSFSLLRISTLIFALATLLVFFSLLNKINNKPHLNFFIVLALWLNPIFYNLSFTFMTDIPALFFFLTSLFSFFLAFKQKNPWWILTGSLLSVIGFFTRQTNILVMVAAGLYSLTQLKNIKFRNLLWSFGLPTIIWSIIYLYLTAKQLLPQGATYHYVQGTAWEICKHTLWWLWYSCIYLGLFALPFALSYGLKNFKQHIRNIKLISFVSLPIIIALILRQTLQVQFPYIMNIITEHGLGPMYNVLNGNLYSLFPSKIWGVITLILAASSGWLLYIIGQSKKLFTHKFSFFYLTAILYLITIIAFHSFDRYYLPLFVIVGIILAQHLSFKKIYLPATIAVLTILAIYNISQTKFYLAWNQARWQMADQIWQETKVQPQQIDGGYEWDGWHAYWSAYASELPHGAWTAPWWIKYLFVNNSEDYIISFSPLEPYQVIETKKIPGWNPNNTLYLLQKPTN